jgi:Flp pilus assembly pilin Flp
MPAYPVHTMRDNMKRVRGGVGRMLRRLQTDGGAVATEYGLTLLLISLAIIVAAAAFGLALEGLYEQGTAGVEPIAGP